MVFSKEDKFLLVKIYKSYLEGFDIYDREQILELFKDIFLKVKSKYKLSGLFDVDIYINEAYGMIIEIDNICFYKGDVDIKIKVHLDSLFLIEIDSSKILDYDDVYYYKDVFYGIYSDINDKDIIYKDVDEIINNGIKVC